MVVLGGGWTFDFGPTKVILESFGEHASKLARSSKMGGCRPKQKTFWLYICRTQWGTFNLRHIKVMLWLFSALKIDPYLKTIWSYSEKTKILSSWVQVGCILIKFENGRAKIIWVFFFGEFRLEIGSWTRRRMIVDRNWQTWCLLYLRSANEAILPFEPQNDGKMSVFGTPPSDPRSSVWGHLVTGLKIIP